MQDLTLVGVHEDGEHLVLAGAGGQQFRVRVDESLRAAVRRDRARLGQLQVDSEGLRPREIQARIRAGQSAEDIAAAAGVPVEHVRRFEGPVLAEREFVADQARRVRLRRTGAGMTALTLGELVQQRLAQRDVDDAEMIWDAWREDDGTWVVCLGFASGATRRRAHWTYDTQLRHVSPRDEEARWFTEEERPDTAVTGRRLSPIREATRERDRPQRDAVRERVYDVETDDPAGPYGERSGPRYPEPRSDRQVARQPDRHGDPRQADQHSAEEYPDEHFHPERYENVRYGEDRFREDPYREELYGEDRPAEVRRATVDLLDTLRERRGRRQHLVPADPATADAVDAAVETLRSRAEAAGELVSPRTRNRGETGDPEQATPGDDVIELPESQDPAPPRPSPAASVPVPSPVATPVPTPSPAASGSRNGRDRGAGRAVSVGHPAVGHPAGVARRAGQRAERERAERERSAGRGRGTPNPGTGGVPAAGGSDAPAPGAPVPADPGRSVSPSRSGGGGAPIGHPSPAAPPAPPAPAAVPPAPPGAREPETATPQTPANERPGPANRRNKRASVPSWDDIVFGSRRE
ncbi:MAG TPA: septation protein SepH [Kineosporiaceae bacterium]|nr:septation protein SepH [Kineosporiaceae bacterium]